MILVAGSANLDFVVRAAHIPAPGETVLGNSFQTFPGGKGANQAVACARAGGVETHFLAALGADAQASVLEAAMLQAGVRLHAVRSAIQATGCAFICVSDDGENAITVAPGANLTLQAAHLPVLDGFSHLLLQLEIPLETATAYAQAARAAGVCVVLNAAPAQALPAPLLDATDVLVVNETELAGVSQHPGTVIECLKKLAVPTVVVTLGSLGCCAWNDGELLLQPAFAVEVVDSTGAGDTFCGALCAQLSLARSMPDALRYAGAAAALACTRLGAQSGIPSASEVEALLRTAQTATSATSDGLQALRQRCGLSD